MDLAPPPLLFPKPAIIRPATAELLKYGGPALALAGLGAPSLLFKNKGGAPPTATYVVGSLVGSTANATEYTFTNHPIGVAAADRLVVVIAQGEGAGASNQTLSTLTIGGNSASIITQGNAASEQTAIAHLLVAAGTTATIVVTWSGARVRMAIAVYAVYDLASTTPVDFAASAPDSLVDPISVQVDVADGGIVIAGAGAGSGTIAWTGVTEDDEITVESALRAGCASSQSMAAETNRTITADFTSAVGESSIAAVSYR